MDFREVNSNEFIFKSGWKAKISIFYPDDRSESNGVVGLYQIQLESSDGDMKFLEAVEIGCCEKGFLVEKLFQKNRLLVPDAGQEERVARQFLTFSFGF